MDLSHFKKREDVDESAWQAWLGSEKTDEPQAKNKPFRLPTKPSQVKTFDGMLSSEVKKPLSKPRRKGPGTAGQREIAIHVQLPQLRVPKLHPSSRQVKLSLGALIIIGGMLLGGKLLLNQSSGSSGIGKLAPVIPQAELGYRPLVAPKKADGTAPTASEPVFDSKRKLYTFTDVFMGAKLTVNQQALPEKFKVSPTGILELAKNLGATEQFSASAGDAFLYTEELSESQRLMLANKKMLMFIQSTKKLSQADWVQYIQSLE